MCFISGTEEITSLEDSQVLPVRPSETEEYSEDVRVIRSNSLRQKAELDFLSNDLKEQEFGNLRIKGKF
jgi:hypothetical protein